jgi:hypothetical protein
MICAIQPPSHAIKLVPAAMAIRMARIAASI